MWIPGQRFGMDGSDRQTWYSASMEYPDRPSARRSFSLLLALVASCSTKQAPPVDVALQPESASGFRSVEPSRARKFMAATANPEATQAAIEMLEAGGNAMDAVVAAQLVLGVVEPQSSGIGGGAFLLYYDAEFDRVYAYDGRETAPAAMQPDAFLREDGTPQPFRDAVVGGVSVGVPGVLAALGFSHSEFGTRPWNEVFEPSIRLARDGWNVHPRLANGLRSVPELFASAGADSMFFNAQGETRTVGERVRNPALAQTLTVLARDGIDSFYLGPIGADLVSAVRTDSAATLTVEDLASYRPRRTDAVCASYRGYRVCGAPPPAGSVVALTVLKLLEGVDLSGFEPGGVPFLHLFAQASELAYSDRDAYYADPGFSPVPLEALLDEERLDAGRAQLTEALRAANPMTLPPVALEPKKHPLCDGREAEGEPAELPSTSHISIMDSFGNVASMTTSVESNFGSRRLSGGFVLNNQLTDFAFEPCADGVLKANAVQGGKRPRSSMSPLIVFDSSDRPVLAVGSPGGAAIIAYSAQTVIGVLDWGLDPQEAVSLPHVVARGGRTVVEEHPDVTDGMIEQLVELGHTVQRMSLTSGLSVVQRTTGGFSGGADPRRDGVAQGDAISENTDARKP